MIELEAKIYARVILSINFLLFKEEKREREREREKERESQNYARPSYFCFYTNK